MGKLLKAWWWRNIKYRKKLIKILFADKFQPHLFEIMKSSTTELIYVGKGFFVSFSIKNPGK